MHDYNPHSSPGDILVEIGDIEFLSAELRELWEMGIARPTRIKINPENIILSGTDEQFRSVTTTGPFINLTGQGYKRFKLVDTGNRTYITFFLPVYWDISSDNSRLIRKSMGIAQKPSALNDYELMDYSDIDRKIIKGLLASELDPFPELLSRICSYYSLHESWYYTGDESGWITSSIIEQAGPHKYLHEQEDYVRLMRVFGSGMSLVDFCEFPLETVVALLEDSERFLFALDILAVEGVLTPPLAVQISFEICRDLIMRSEFRERVPEEAMKLWENFLVSLANSKRPNWDALCMEASDVHEAWRAGMADYPTPGQPGFTSFELVNHILIRIGNGDFDAVYISIVDYLREIPAEREHAWNTIRRVISSILPA